MAYVIQNGILRTVDWKTTVKYSISFVMHIAASNYSCGICDKMHSVDSNWDKMSTALFKSMSICNFSRKKTTQIIYSSFAACFPNSIPFDWTIMCWMILFMSIIQFMMIKIYTQHTWSVFLIVFMQINPFNPVFIRIIGMYILVGCPHHSVYCPKSNCFWFRFFCSNNVPHCR